MTTPRCVTCWQPMGQIAPTRWLCACGHRAVSYPPTERDLHWLHP